MLKNPRIWKFDELYLLGVLRSIGCMLDIAPLIGCNFKHKLTLTNALNTINYQANGLFNNAVDQQIKLFVETIDLALHSYGSSLHLPTTH
jgi:hypothetical protein